MNALQSLSPYRAVDSGTYANEQQQRFFRVFQYKLEGCIVLNEHNTDYGIRPKRSAIFKRCFPAGPIRVVDANGISITSAFLQSSLGDRPTDRPTDHAIRSVTVEKPNFVIVYGYNKYLLEQSTRQIGSTSAISSYIQLLD